ncbi:hypothetical protein SETIT_2G314500v2 [Setaria italica]|uniref:Charged multivesicular body protein 3 n=2 Tax=Setaria italica TaxID=4555 RepID=A0A368Q4U4_SETIT|nr:hypothetical protein SETIT_2G314500v2 [Setaria italica]
MIDRGFSSLSPRAVRGVFSIDRHRIVLRTACACVSAEAPREEKKVEKAIREAAKRNDMASVKTLAKELVRSRRALSRLYENKAHISSVFMRLGEIIGTKRTTECLSKSAEVMNIVNDLMKAPELAGTMQQFGKEMLKVEVMEEMVNEIVDSALDSEDLEDEIEEEVDKVLAALGAEIASRLPAAQRIKQGSMSRVPGQQVASNKLSMRVSMVARKI